MNRFGRSFVSLEGVAPRSEWWRVATAIGALYLVVGVIGAWTGWTWTLLAAMADQPLVAGLFNLVWWLPAIPVSIRRLRDRRLQPWWLAAPVVWTFLAPGLVTAADAAGALMVGNVLQILGLILSIVIFVQLAVLPSKATPSPPPEPAA
ncbi:DUF805 domain-containing protein [Phenylobacterium sp. J426]|uniref:DUF805 domain-containing protein n=1 Tax=Phenylobacterium sp. J426 TaxID=2898439 RepID=UPI002151CBC8|nr:DUF805 domain-containing protein [Phenylobacterium sp. J426]MCR5875236.1 DUF805 domain-containing protein [Phenylobacterium sp. J426]